MSLVDRKTAERKHWRPLFCHSVMRRRVAIKKKRKKKGTLERFCDRPPSEAHFAIGLPPVNQGNFMSAKRKKKSQDAPGLHHISHLYRRRRAKMHNIRRAQNRSQSDNLRPKAPSTPAVPRHLWKTRWNFAGPDRPPPTEVPAMEVQQPLPLRESRCHEKVMEKNNSMISNRSVLHERWWLHILYRLRRLPRHELKSRLRNFAVMPLKCVGQQSTQ